MMKCREFTTELVRLKVDVIVTATGPAPVLQKRRSISIEGPDR
jgi:hypothetical protein